MNVSLCLTRSSFGERVFSMTERGKIEDMQNFK